MNQYEKRKVWSEAVRKSRREAASSRSTATEFTLLVTAEAALAGKKKKESEENAFVPYDQQQRKQTPRTRKLSTLHNTGNAGKGEDRTRRRKRDKIRRMMRGLSFERRVYLILVFSIKVLVSAILGM